MTASLENLYALREKIARIEPDEYGSGLVFFRTDEKALMLRLVDEYLIESEEIESETDPRKYDHCI